MRIDAFLQQSPMFAVSRAARHLESAAARALADCGLGFFEALVLSGLFFEAPRQVKPSELAATFATTRGCVSHCVTSLEAKGLVQRSIDPTDARVFLLTLKPQGKRVALRAIAALDDLQKRFEDGMGKTALGETIGGIQRLDSLLRVK